MIPYNSRYDTEGEIVVAPSRNIGEVQTAVFRVFPGSHTGTFGQYTWRDGDRIDKVAVFFAGESQRWWEIMDLNPEIHSPAEIAPGMSIRVPLTKVDKDLL